MNKHLILMLTIAALLALLFTSCNLTGVTIEARIYQFVSDLNATDRSNIYLNFHPRCTDYLAIHDSAYFNIAFPPVETDLKSYSIVPVTLDTSNESAVTALLDGPDLFCAGTPLRITCSMEIYGNDWQIRVLDLEGYVDNPLVQ